MTARFPSQRFTLNAPRLPLRNLSVNSRPALGLSQHVPTTPPTIDTIPSEGPPHLTTNETSRVKRFRQGDASAFNELYDELGTRLYRFCFRLCGDKDDAEDLMAEVFLAAYSGREKFEGRSSLTTWLYRIAVYQWGRMRRSKRATVPLEDHHEQTVQEVGIHSVALEQALAELPESLVQAFVLVKCEQLCYREAAEVLGVPMGTIQFRVHEASQRLRKSLAETVPDALAGLDAAPKPAIERCM